MKDVDRQNEHPDPQGDPVAWARLLGQRVATLGAGLITTAESCTGGLIAAALTETAGSSAWFSRGYVTYANQAKIEMLGVDAATLEAEGAVSTSVASQMALGALRSSDALLSMAVSGIAGPDGGTAEKPVGTVCFGWALRWPPGTPEPLVLTETRQRRTSSRSWPDSPAHRETIMTASLFSLQGQTALVTGGAKGIGKGIVSVLRQAGANVVIADIDREQGQATAKELGAHYQHTDVRVQQSCQDAVAAVVERFGALDILCSNTGIFPQKKLADMTEADWDQTHGINLKGTFLMVQAALAAMQPRGYGRIVITSSITGPVTGFPGWSHYGASKAGQLGFMRSAALEYARFGITINAVMPGNVLSEGLIAQGEEYLNQMRAAVPTHTLGTPQDIGYAACFLASREAAYITGQTIIIDGGQILPESAEALL